MSQACAVPASGNRLDFESTTTGHIRLNRILRFFEPKPSLFSMQSNGVDFPGWIIGQRLDLFGQSARRRRVFVLQPKMSEDQIRLRLKPAQPGGVRRFETRMHGPAASIERTLQAHDQPDPEESPKFQGLK